MKSVRSKLCLNLNKDFKNKLPKNLIGFLSLDLKEFCLKYKREYNLVSALEEKMDRNSYILKYYLIRFNNWGVPLEFINRNTLHSSVGTMVINIIFIPLLSFILLGLNLLLGPHNPQSFLLGDILSNSGKVLKLIIPNYILNYFSGWSNYSCKVTIYKIYESIIGYRGSKLAKIFFFFC